MCGVGNPLAVSASPSDRARNISINAIVSFVCNVDFTSQLYLCGPAWLSRYAEVLVGSLHAGSNFSFFLGKYSMSQIK
jgi:hypothetical protein